MAVARKHHFVAQSFLRGFADAEGKLFVHDFHTGKDRRVDPKEVAHERDFYAVNIPGLRPDVLETEFGRVEGASVEIIRRIERDKTLTTTDDFGQLLYFIALQGLRGPDHRDRLDTMAASAREQSEAIIRSMYRVHVATRPNPPPEDEWVAAELDRNFPGQMTREEHIQSMLRLHGGLLSALDEMRSVFTMLPDKPGFELVCSDAPFTCLVPISPAAGWRWAGWRERGAMISMALSKRLFWQAQWEPKPDLFVDASDSAHADTARFAAATTAISNGYTTLTPRFVYASRPGGPDGLPPEWPAPQPSAGKP
jgi:hypothetical protein